MIGILWFVGLLAAILLGDWLLVLATPHNPNGTIPTSGRAVETHPRVSGPVSTSVGAATPTSASTGLHLTRTRHG